MAGNKRPRKQYRPKQQCLPKTIALGRDATWRLQMVPHQQLEKMREGLGDEISWNTLACRLNVGLTLADRWFPLLKSDIDDALAALREVWLRYEMLRKMGVNGDQFRIIGRGLVFTDEMQTQCTRREIMGVTDEVFSKAAIYDEEVKRAA